MSVRHEERLQAVWGRLPSHEQEEVLDFAEFLASRRGGTLISEECLSEEEHARLVAALDAVAALSLETGPAVNNRTHDADLYGKP